MNKNIKLLVLILFFGEIIFSSELEIGKKMPGIDYPLLGIDGKNVTLGDIKGATGTLVIFSCNTCPWVLRWEDRYVSIASRYSQKGIGIIALNSNVARFDGDDSLEKMVKHAKKTIIIFLTSKTQMQSLPMLLVQLRHLIYIYLMMTICLYTVELLMIMQGVHLRLMNPF